ncbi:MAG: M23 family metallopeptidase [Firmicutes bacterium]|nr:M23 family metallopeptidase [Bacillota bacterium]
MTRKIKFPRRWLEKRLPLKTYRENWQKRMEAARLTLRSASKGLTRGGLLRAKGWTYLLVFFLLLASGAGGYYLARRAVSPVDLEKGEGPSVVGEMVADFETPTFSDDKEDGAGAGVTEGEVVVDDGASTGERVPPGEGPAAAPVAEVDGEGGGESPVLETVPASEESAGLSENPIAPVVAPLSSAFGWRLHPVYKDWRYHSGVDLAVPAKTPVQAVLDGVVEDIYEDQHLGPVIILGHGQGYETRYGHCQEMLVKVGQHISQGEVIATVGEAGLDGQTHLHFELRRHGQALDPEEYLPFESLPRD